ncbi:PAS domain-containing protein [Corallococcus exercitus]|uniref:histidine kinase n=1 Tax=Corallococcus exercitus TaxID=2316736 RepID=A0A7Y4KHY6_9BACT|nr:PAS domain-containing protein [Corallococcus exercitus]
MRDAVRQLLTAPRSRTARFSVAVVAALVSTGLSALLEPWVGGHYFVVPLSGVILSALYGGVGAGLVTTVLNIAGFVLLPYFPMVATRPPLLEDFLRALVFTVVAALLSWVGAALRDSYLRNEQARLEAEQARSEVERTSAARWAADEARRVADARLIEVLERMSDASFTLDADWRFLYVNREGERVMGLPRESLVGRRLWDVFPATLGSAFERYYRQVIETQQPVEFVEFYPPFQAYFEARVFPVQDGISVFFRDVTAPRRAQQSLRESEARFRSLVLAIAQVVWTTSAEGLIEEDSASWRAFTGQTFEEMKGYGWLNALHPDDRAQAASVWKEALARRGLYEVEYRVRRPDGTYTPVLARAAPVLNADGSIREWMGTNTDITERRRAAAVQTVLVEAGRLLSESLDPHVIAKSIVQLASEQLADHGVLDLLDARTGRLERMAVFTPDPTLRPLLDEALPPTPDLDAHNPAAEALRSGSPRLLTVTPEVRQRLAGTQRQREALARLDPRSVALVPLIVRDRKVGLLSLGWTGRVRQPTEDDLSVVMAVADRAALALEQARLHEELRQSEARLHAIVENSPAAIFLKSMTGEYLLVNRRFTEVTGGITGSPLGRTDEEFLSSAIATAVRANDQEVLHHGRVVEREEVVPMPGGEQRTYLSIKFPLFDAQGHAFAVGGIATDITERKQAEAQLRRYAERLEALHAIDRAILQAVSLQDVARTALSSLRRLVGCDEASLLIIEPGAEVSRWTVSAEAPEALRHERLRSASDASPRERPHWLELPLTLGGGRQGALQLTSTREEAFDGMATQVAEEVAAQVAIALEQGRLRRELELHASGLEAQVTARTTELQEANAQLEAFSYSVSHDLRAPLRGIDGFLRLVEEDVAGALSERGRGYLARVRAAAGRMGQLIDDLLKLSRLSRAPLERGDVDVSSLAASVAEELRARDPTRAVEVSVAPGLRARADNRLLRVAFENLLGNAWKFTGRRETGHIQVGKADGAFFVRDDGAGFDMAYSDKLFAPFQRLHDATEYPGTGIGLATVQRIVRRHGGRLWTEAAVDQGATFYFTLGDSP